MILKRDKYLMLLGWEGSTEESANLDGSAGDRKTQGPAPSVSNTGTSNNFATLRILRGA